MKNRIGGGDPVHFNQNTGDFPHIRNTLNTMGFKDEDINLKPTTGVTSTTGSRRTGTEGFIAEHNLGIKDIPSVFELKNNYPNPFNPSTNINFNLPESGLVTLKVYNLLGQEIAELVNGRMVSGSHSINFDASGLSSGVYIYRLQAGNQVQTKKMMLIK
mgnify:CR=1 FL=1